MGVKQKGSRDGSLFHLVFSGRLRFLTTHAVGIGWAGRLANDELGQDRYNIRKCGLASNSLQQNASGREAHLLQRLTDGGETGIVIRRALNVVKAYDRDIFRHAQPTIDEGANGPDSGNIVVADERGEFGTSADEFVGGTKTHLGR